MVVVIDVRANCCVIIVPFLGVVSKNRGAANCSGNLAIFIRVTEAAEEFREDLFLGHFTGLDLGVLRAVVYSSTDALVAEEEDC